MDVSKDALPPSPPMTDSSSPSTAAFISPRETPPFSPQVRSAHSNSPSVAISPLPGLPPELFLNVLSFLPQEDVEIALGVSRSWYSFLHNEPSLWNTVDVFLNDFSMERVKRICRRSTVNGRRSHGGIRKLILTLQYQQRRDGRRLDVVSFEDISERLEELIDEVARASVLQSVLAAPRGARVAARSPLSTLRSLSVYLYPNTLTSAQVMHEISGWSGLPVFSGLEQCVLSLPPS
jgi:hypothetical protein